MSAFFRLLLQSLLPLLLLFVVCTTAADPSNVEKQELTAGGLTSAIVPKKEVFALEGYPVTISCQSASNRPLESCRWERRPPVNGTRYFVSLRPSKDNNTSLVSSPDANCNCSYEYVGPGLDRGDCSLKISSIHKFHITTWECLLNGENKETTWLGSLNITDLEPISKPFFANKEILDNLIYNSSEASDPVNVTCCTFGDSPTLPVYLRIDLKNESDPSDALSEPQVKFPNTSREARYCKHTPFHFLPEHNQQKLTCDAWYSLDSHRYHRSVSHSLVVKFAPVLTRGENFTLRLTESNSLQVNVTFLANPLPSIKWYLTSDGKSGASFEIGKNHTKYKTRSSVSNGDEWEALLEILNVTSEDYRRTFLVKLENPYGSKEIPVSIVDPSSDESSDGFLLILVIGILAAGLLLAFIVACVLSTVARKRHGDYDVPPVVHFQSATAADSATEIES